MEQVKRGHKDILKQKYSSLPGMLKCPLNYRIWLLKGTLEVPYSNLLLQVRL